MGEGRPTMRFNPHPNKEGTEIGKLFKPALPSPSAYAPPVSSLPATSWPPSFVPTWQTTTWAGVYFSRLTSSGLVIMRRRDTSPGRIASVMSGSHCREPAPLGARARAPPRSRPAGKGRSERGFHLSRCSRGYRESQTNDTSQKRRAENATRSPSPVCSKFYRKDSFAPPLSGVLTPLPRGAGA